VNLNKLKYLRNDDVMGGAKCTARPRTPLPYTTDKEQIKISEHGLGQEEETNRNANHISM
jgi:hypothetical protein